jgi:hypothetical protein
MGITQDRRNPWHHPGSPAKPLSRIPGFLPCRCLCHFMRERLPRYARQGAAPCGPSLLSLGSTSGASARCANDCRLRHCKRVFGQARLSKERSSRHLSCFPPPPRSPPSHTTPRAAPPQPWPNNAPIWPRRATPSSRRTASTASTHRNFQVCFCHGARVWTVRHRHRHAARRAAGGRIFETREARRHARRLPPGALIGVLSRCSAVHICTKHVYVRSSALK